MLSAVGQPVPDTPHAVSVSLPSWKANVGYEEGEDWVLSKLKTGYPRFFIHLIIQDLEKEVLGRYGTAGERVMLFPSPATARICQQFFTDKAPTVAPADVRLLTLAPIASKLANQETAVSGLSCVFFPKAEFSTAKQVWQHSGDGISSRRGEFCLKALKNGLLRPIDRSPTPKHDDQLFCKGPRRYQKGHSSPTTEGKEFAQFIEERFGRNLNAVLASKAKLAIRRRIAGCLTENSELDEALQSSSNPIFCRVKGLNEDDVYLYPCGMSAIFNTHRVLKATNPEPRKSICFGFPYIDTLKILQKWGAGCLFYGHGTSADLDDLESRLVSGERFLALFTEFPSNPLLRSPDLARIRSLADTYGFAVVVDETVGNFINTNLLPLADVVVSSLTKVFSGDSNVMGGASVLNPHSRQYAALKRTLAVEYEDNYWAEDAVFMERNSRDFVARIARCNANTDAIVSVLLQHQASSSKPASPSNCVQQVYYPQFGPTRTNYERCRSPGGGFGGLLSVTFTEAQFAVAFFDALEVQKGPSLGTNFTLCCPYTILAHYGELDWAAEFGVETELIRVSVGLEEQEDLLRRFQRALAAVEEVAGR